MESAAIANSLQKLIIEERKADSKASAERRRRQNLASSGGLHPLDIFPRVVWELIFERLTDPDGITAAWNACSFFREVIGRDKYFSHVLFPTVFSMKHLKITQSGWRFLSKLRFVNKTWNEAVDQLAIREIEENEGNKHRCIYSFIVAPSERQYQLLDSILANLGNRRRQLFPNIRSLDINLYYQQGNNDRLRTLLSSKLNAFLEAIGHQVLRLEVFANTGWLRRLGGQTPKSFYLAVQQWILHLPHLKCLDLDLFINASELALCQVDSELVDLQEAIRSHPFPCLSSLQSLKVLGCRLGDGKFLLPVYTAVLNSNKELKELKVEPDLLMHNIDELDDQFRASVRALGDLESFHATSVEQDLPYLPEYYSVPSPCFNLNWKLKRISLTHGVTLSSRLFQLLENFPTLEWLELGLIFSQGSRFDSPFLHLPNVTVASIKIIRSCQLGLINVDFLFPLKKLSVLKWKELAESQEVSEEVETNEMIHFQRGRCDLYRSNIWEVFPSLSLIEVQHCRDKKKEYKRGLRI